ncbi:MAG: exodeoxyribonuclease V subunit alpha [Buchnera aphidicola (Eriosoma harunire)]
MKNIIIQAFQKKQITSLDLYFALYIGHQQHNLIMITAAITNHHIGNGHICLPLNILKKKIIHLENMLNIPEKIFELTGSFILWNEIFKSSDSIGSSRLKKPLILFNQCIYLYKTWKAEQIILNYITKKKRDSIPQWKHYRKIINNICNHDDIHHLQKIAISMAIIQNISFIIGGPGTGKTTIIQKILTAILEIYPNTIKCQLAAPTGKAATHLTQSVYNSNNKTLKLNLLKFKIIPATTIHTLLGISKINSKPYFHENNKLDIDILIIDESSMIDFFMMEKLINALPKHVKLIFFGDINQIPSIGHGNILKDICYQSDNTFYDIAKLLKLISNCNINTKKHPNLINDNICILTKNYRFAKKSDIIQLSYYILHTRKDIFEKIKNNYFNQIHIDTISSHDQYILLLEYIIQKYSTYWDKIIQKKPIHHIIKAFNSIKILCAVKHNILGTKHINNNLEKYMEKKGLINYINNNNCTGYIGKPIIISENNKMLGLVNGDIGIMKLNNKKQLYVCFLKNDKETKKIPINILPKYQTAWAITIHRSQGSEFLHTILILPNVMNPILTKELIYTGITRSKETLTIYAKKNILLQSIKRQIIRISNIPQFMSKNRNI